VKGGEIMKKYLSIGLAKEIREVVKDMTPKEKEDFMKELQAIEPEGKEPSPFDCEEGCY